MSLCARKSDQRGKTTMTKGVLCCVSILALMAASPPVRAAEPGARDGPMVRGAASKSSRTGGDCEARMRKLEASDAEGEERLNEKHAVIDICDRQYRSDKTIDR